MRGARRARGTLPLAAATLLAALVSPGCHGSQTSARPGATITTHPTVVPSPRRGVVDSPDPRELDLQDLVPHAGRIDHVWYVRAGSTAPEVAVAWSYRGSHVTSAPSDERYALTVWRPVRLSPGEARWRPHTLFRGSPFPLGGRSVRTADVTGDGHPDLLVTVECNVCNHGAATAAVFADARTGVRRTWASTAGRSWRPPGAPGTGFSGSTSRGVAGPFAARTIVFRRSCAGGKAAGGESRRAGWIRLATDSSGSGRCRRRDGPGATGPRRRRL
jgi:hypothetical protein